MLKARRSAVTQERRRGGSREGLDCFKDKYVLYRSIATDGGERVSVVCLLWTLGS